MAVELCAAQTIPRISFSHDFCSSMQQCCLPLLSASMPLNSSCDFEFDVRINNFDQECYYSSADELFSNGKILPLQIKESISPSKQEQKPSLTIPQATNASSKDQNQSSKSFWQFKRSSSLNFISGYKRRFCSSSTLLSRSSSTGSAPKVKPGSVLKDGRGIGNLKQNYPKEKSLPCLQSSTSKHKPPLKKSYTYGSHGNGVTINPILHVPLVDVFCLSSVFLTGKGKK
ncbi:uncharacterized protein LOC111306585 [Durio zibethinus]|uniref:Uncharacterized protein LOC111306585 n=1 Tax=Durio zibethinus TaxID=66656 RepID=A0A6P6A591_DURZI|nr:uncharacterized protein LOC111306585 [Durio zibethinus]